MPAPLPHRHAQYDVNEVNLAKVSLKALVLGVVLLVNATLLVLQAAGLARFSSPILMQINIFLVSVAVFHLLEFLITAHVNNSQVDDDSYLLEDPDIYLLYSVSVLEALAKTYLFGTSLGAYAVPGVVILVVGQLARSVAMYTGGESFNHYIQREHDEQRHKLVTHGIYRLFRHPSYFGYFWWVVGLEVLLGSYLTGAWSVFKLWQFFNKRIAFEEKFLVAFFKEDYVRYRATTSTYIPFIA